MAAKFENSPIQRYICPHCDYDHHRIDLHKCRVCFRWGHGGNSHCGKCLAYKPNHSLDDCPKFCNLCKRIGHSIHICPLCKEPGHRKNDCPTISKKDEVEIKHQIQSDFKRCRICRIIKNYEGPCTGRGSKPIHFCSTCGKFDAHPIKKGKNKCKSKISPKISYQSHISGIYCNICRGPKENNMPCFGISDGAWDFGPSPNPYKHGSMGIHYCDKCDGYHRGIKCNNYPIGILAQTAVKIPQKSTVKLKYVILAIFTMVIAILLICDFFYS